MKFEEDKKILDVQNLTTVFETKGKVLKAVDKVSFHLAPGKVLGIVGESGCGKTVTSLSLMRLVDRPGRIAKGKILYYGKNGQVSENGPVSLLDISEPKMRKIRGKEMAMIFQEPMTSLNPVYTVGNQIMEAILLHQDVGKQEAKAIATHMLEKVKIPDPDKRMNDYPHQLSGGMRQRVMIAMALVCQPGILIADEPTTALDVTVQAQILELIKELVSEMNMSVILITHDFGVVSQICDEVLVMYAGKVVEEAPIARLLKNPKHPYTMGLLNSIPSIEKTEQELKSIPGKVPDLAQLLPGCRFADRCERVIHACHQQVPAMKYVGGGQRVRCLNY